MDWLEPPLVADQFAGQPVEQFRMRGRLTAGTEIARRRYEPGAQMVLPQAIDNNAGQQMSGSVFNIGNPMGDGRSRRKCLVCTVALPAVRVVSASHQHLGKTLRNNIPFSGDITARKKINVGLESESAWQRIAARIHRRIHLLTVNLYFATDRFGKRSDQPVIVALRNRIVLVIVTTSAAHGQPQQARAQRGDHIFQLVVAVPLEFLFGLNDVFHSRHEKAGGGTCLRVVGLQQITGDLPADKLIVRHILIQGLDDKVTVVVGRAAILVHFKAVALAKPRQVEPMSSPAFAVVLVIEQPIDQLLISFRRIVCDKCLQFIR